MPICNAQEFRQILSNGTRVLGLDYGTRLIGVAISDPGLVLATPVSTIERKRLADDIAALVALVRDYKAGGLVIGLPLNMDGSESRMAQSARAFIRNLLKSGALHNSNMPILFWDERLSTFAVERMMLAGDASRAQRAANKDKLAAAYILQGFLDSLRKEHD